MSATEEAVSESGTSKGFDLLANFDAGAAKIMADREASPDAQPVTDQTPVTPAQAAPPAVDWREVELVGDDVPEFLRGKKVTDALKSWQHAEATLKTAQQRAADSAREAEQLRREREADQAAIRVQQRREAQPEPEPESDDEIGIFTKADLKRYAQEIASAEIAKYSAAADTGKQIETWKQQGQDAYLAAQKATGLDDATWEKRARAVMYALTDPNDVWASQGGPLVTAHYLTVYKDLFGDLPTQATAPAQPVVPVPTAPNPPGSKSVVVAAHTRQLPSVSTEKSLAIEAFAATLGKVSPKLDQDKLAARMTRGE